MFQESHLNAVSLPFVLISGPTRDFHFRLQPCNSTSCSDRKMTQENTQQEEKGEKGREVKKVYLSCSSCQLRQTASVCFTLGVQGIVGGVL